MTQITILEHVVYADGSANPVSVTVTKDGCTVAWQQRATDASLTWAQMGDVEHLSDVFEDSSVRAFKVIVQVLGKVYANKEAFMMVL